MITMDAVRATLTKRRQRKARMLSNKPHKMQIMIDNDSEPVQVLAQPSESYRRLSEIPTTEIREGEL